MAQYRIPDEDCENLQYNLIRSHAAGAGKPLSAENVRALMLARMNTLALGKSGIHREVIETMQQLLNKNVVPLIFEHGGVGASGDLVQLAHLALVLIGEGEVFTMELDRKRAPFLKIWESTPFRFIFAKVLRC